MYQIFKVRGTELLNSHQELQTCIIQCYVPDGILLVFLFEGTVDYRGSLPCVLFF